jgi:hypothetical protein
MTEQKKDKFLGMAKATLGTNKPIGLADFLDNTEDNQNIRKTVNTENRKDKKITSKPAREEFRFTEELANRLRKYAYEKRLKKVDIVTLALEKFFDDEGY